jgi:hypothetical protein
VLLKEVEKRNHQESSVRGLQQVAVIAFYAATQEVDKTACVLPSLASVWMQPVEILRGYTSVTHGSLEP